MAALARQPNFEFFSNFISTVKIKFENNESLNEPIEYVASVFEKLRVLNVQDKIDIDLMKQHVKNCRMIIDEETSPEDHIFPHLLKLAQYLVSFIKSLDLEVRNNQRNQNSELSSNQAIPSHIDKSDQNCIIKPIDAVNEEFSCKNKPEKPKDETKIDKSNSVTNKEIIEDNTVNIKITTDDKIVVDDEERKEEDTRDHDNVNEEEELSEYDEKILARIEKLDKFCLKARKAIEDLERHELSYKEMDSFESNYIKDNILKKRFTEAYKRLRKLCRENPHLVDGEIPKKLGGQFSKPIFLKDSKYPEINSKLTQKLDKNKSFPDFYDVSLWVTEANEEAKLNLKKEILEEIARSSFKEIGRILKERRRKDTEMSFNSRLEENLEDSHFENLHKDVDLMQKLNNNKKIAYQKETNVLDSFADKQELDDKDDSKTDSDDEDSIEKTAESTDEEDLDNSENSTEDETEIKSKQINTFSSCDKVGKKRPLSGSVTKSNEILLGEKSSFETPKKIKINPTAEPLTPGSSNKMGISILSVSSAVASKPKIEIKQDANNGQINSEDTCIILD